MGQAGAGRRCGARSVGDRVTLVDTHAHLVTGDTANYPPAPPSGELKPDDLADPMTVERLLGEMDANGVGRALLVQRAAEIPGESIHGSRTLSLSAGASAPEIIVDEIIESFRARFDVKVELAETIEETENFPVVRTLRDVELTRADMAFVNGA